MQNPAGLGGGYVLYLQRRLISSALNFYSHLLWPIHSQIVQDSIVLASDWHLFRQQVVPVVEYLHWIDVF